MPALTSSQQAAVLHFEGDSAILAGAGSGKTFVIVEKVAALVERLHVPPERILITTFTEKAAEEVGKRIGGRLKLKEGSSRPFVSTVHGFAAEALRNEGSPLGIPPDFKILTDFLTALEKGRCVREKVLERIEAGDTEALDGVGRFGFGKVLGLFFDLLSEPAHRRVEAPFPKMWEAISEHYGKRKTALNALDFDDLEERLLALLRASPEAFARKFSWIIVDEFQDTSPMQWDLLSALKKACSASLVLVGDPRQSIYRFRGADPSLFLKAARSMTENGGRLFHLAENFRSVPEIVAFVNAVSEPLFPEDFPPMAAVRHDTPGRVERIFLEDGPMDPFRTAEAEAVARRFAELRAEGHLWKTMAVLFRTRKAVPYYEKAFKARGIPYRTSLGEPLLDRPEVLALLFWMVKRAKVSKTELKFLETGLSHSALKNFTEDFPTHPLPAYLDLLFDACRELFPEAVRLNLKAFRSLLNDLTALGVVHLKTLVENLEALREAGARIACPEAPEVQGAKADATTLMTVHGAKGLEWPIVALGDLKATPPRPSSLYLSSDEGELAMKDGDRDASGLKTKFRKGEDFTRIETREREEGLEESKRLLYVALTRARDRLILILPASKETARKAVRQTPSGRWSDWLAP